MLGLTYVSPISDKRLKCLRSQLRCTWCTPRLGANSSYGGFHKWGHPKMHGFEGKIPLKWMIWRYPHFRETPIFSRQKHDFWWLNHQISWWQFRSLKNRASYKPSQKRPWEIWRNLSRYHVRQSQIPQNEKRVQTVRRLAVSKWFTIHI